jgi:hypothetical protein
VAGITTRARGAARAGSLALIAGVLAVSASPSAASAASSAVVDFTASGYTLGFHSPDQQNGWWMAKSVDFSLVDNSTFPLAGLPTGRSLQFSNATHLSGGAHLVSPTIDAAGEPSTGAGANTFETSFTVASATGAPQPGLAVDVALDGASRFGGVVNLRHTDEGLEIGSYWYPAGAADDSLASWRSAVFATVDAAVPHTIRAVATFIVDAPDTLDIYVDGVLVSAGSGATTWEAYSVSDGDRSVDGISFKTTSSAPSADGIGYRAGLPTAPATEGKGFLFTAIAYSVRTTSTQPPTVEPMPTPTAPAPPKPEPAPVAPSTPEPTPTEQPPVTLDSVIEEFGADTAALLETYLLETGRDVPPDLEELLTVDGALDLSDFSAWLAWTGDDTVKLYGYSTPTYLGTFPVVNGRAEISGVDLTVLGEGDHHLLIVGEQSGAFEVAQLAIPAAETAQPPADTPAAPIAAGDAGLPIWVIAAIAAVLLAVAIAVVVVLRRRAVY